MEQHRKKDPKSTFAAVKKAVTYLLLTIWAVIVLFPFYWMVLTSLKDYGAYNAEHTPSFFTLAPTLENYRNAFTAVPLMGYLLNTLIFTVITTALMLFVITLAAYAFARLNFRGKDLVFTLFLSLMMIPTELVIITNFATITNLKLRNTFAGLVLPSVTSVFYIYLLKENFEQVPDELYRAAKVDGCGDLRYLLRVMIPMNKNAIATIGILTFISQWNSFIWPLMVSKDDAHRVMAIGLLHFRDAVSSQVNLQMAGATIVLLPMLLFYLAFHKQIIEGVSRGGIKG